ncbi:MAG: hypothetical protein FWE45_00855 [Firmicutes bacterium]|nr:hypothetical protein [Bacillota bacterium]
MFKPAACPKCNSIILVQAGEAFVRCPGCTKNISVEDAWKNLDDFCSVPANTAAMIEKCIILEKKYGPDISMPILGLLHEKYPDNEEIMYLIVKTSGFDSIIVKDYLIKFKDDKKKVSFAEDFLTKALTVRNMEYISMFEDYIESKLRPARKERFKELMRELKASYVKTSTGANALMLLYAFYAIGAAINIAMVIFFLFSDLQLFIYVLVAAGTLGIEISLLYFHNRKFGNRLTTSDRERLFMVIYMATIVLVIGGVFVGGVVSF